jgi:hypothetical protein
VFVPFVRESSGYVSKPTPQLAEALARARTLYGMGMGFASLRILTAIVRVTFGVKWEAEGGTADALAVVDADISQAIQVSSSTPTTALLSLRSSLNFRAARKKWAGGWPVIVTKRTKP